MNFIDNKGIFHDYSGNCLYHRLDSNLSLRRAAACRTAAAVAKIGEFSIAIRNQEWIVRRVRSTEYGVLGKGYCVLGTEYSTFELCLLKHRP